MVESSHEHVLLMISHMDVEPVGNNTKCVIKYIKVQYRLPTDNFLVVVSSNTANFSLTKMRNASKFEKGVRSFSHFHSKTIVYVSSF